MADRRKPKKRKEGPENDKPTKEEYAVAKHVRFKCPTKKSTLFGQKVEYFIASKAIDCLLDSKWAVNTKKADALFTTRESVVQYMDRLLNHQCFFHRAQKIVKTVAVKKKKKKDEEEKVDVKKKTVEEKRKEESDQKSKSKKEIKSGKSETEKEKDAEQEVKEKKKAKLEPHSQQVFLDGNEQVYVWTYDPVSTKTFFFGLLVVLGAIAICLFPLWPPEIRTGVYYLSLSGIGLIGSLLGLSLFRYIIFFIVWCISLGKLHFWIFPNLDADCGFKESFIPAYDYEYKTAKTEQESKDAGSERRESSDSRASGEDADANQPSEGDDQEHTGDTDNDCKKRDTEENDDFEVIQESDVVDQSTVDDEENVSDGNVSAQ